MSTGTLSLDIILNQIAEDATSGRSDAIASLAKRYPSLSDAEVMEIYRMLIDSAKSSSGGQTSLVATAPPMFGIKAKSTMNTVTDMLEQANSSILMTSYSLSDYFSDMVDCIIRKSQTGVFVKIFVNQVENQGHFDKLNRYKGRFLKIYNYPQSEDKMAALHAKVICVDQYRTLITSANLSYHGQQGNIELGTLIESKDIAKQVEDLFTKLLFNKVFTES